MDIFKERRSIRSFRQSKLKKEDLDYIADCARVAPSGANLQPIKFCIITEKAAEIFPFVKWAGYLPEWTPKKDEAPTAYIAILGDKNIKSDNFELDAGITGAAIVYSAESRGISSCWLGAIDRGKISELLGLSENLKLLYLIALGEANQESEEIPMDDEKSEKDRVKYEMDEKGKVFVPKRSFAETVFYR